MNLFNIVFIVLIMDFAVIKEGGTIGVRAYILLIGIPICINTWIFFQILFVRVIFMANRVPIQRILLPLD